MKTSPPRSTSTLNSAKVPDGPDPQAVEFRAPAELTPYRFRYIAIPEPTPEELAQLKHRIRLHGVAEPLAILPDGRIVDGRHRHAEALALGLARVPVHVLALEDPFEIERYALQAAVAQRQLSAAQRFELCEQLRRLEAEHAELRRRATLKQFDGRVDALPRDAQVKGKTLERIARKIGISTRVAERIKTVMDKGPRELFERMVRGEVRPDAAYRQTIEALGPRRRATPPPLKREPNAQRASGSARASPPPPPRPRLTRETVAELEAIFRRVGGWLRETPRWTRKEQEAFYAGLGGLAASVRELLDRVLRPYLHDLPADPRELEAILAQERARGEPSEDTP